jgi:hypothetical protein
MNVIMTCFTERYALALSCYHDFHPERHLPFALLVQVSQLSDMVHLHFFLGVTYFACVVE